MNGQAASGSHVVKGRNKAGRIGGFYLPGVRALAWNLDYSVDEARMAPMWPVIKQEGSTMKAWLNEVFWKLAVTLGFIEPPRMQPIPVRAQRMQPAQRRR
jgi:hypothetical protein